MEIKDVFCSQIKIFCHSEIISVLKKYCLEVEIIRLRGENMIVGRINKANVTLDMLPYIKWFYGFGSKRAFGIQPLDVASGAVFCSALVSGARAGTYGTIAKELKHGSTVTTDKSYIMVKTEKDYDYYRTIPSLSYFGSKIDDSVVYHSIPGQRIIATLESISADEYNLSYMDYMAGVSVPKAKLQDVTTYKHENRSVYFREMRRNYEDAKKILLCLKEDVKTLLSYGDGPGIAVMAYHALGLHKTPFKVYGYDPHMDDLSIHKIFAAKPPLALFDCVLSCHSYSFCCQDFSPSFSKLIVYDRSNPAYIEKLHGIPNKMWNVLRPFLFTTFPGFYLASQFSSVLLSVERERGPLGNNVYNCLHPSYDEMVKNIRTSYVLITNDKTNPVVMSEDNSLIVYTYAFYTSYGSYLPTGKSSAFHFLSFPNAMNISGEDQVYVFRFNTRLCVFWSEGLISSLSSYAVTPFNRMTKSGTLIKCSLYFVGIGESFVFSYNHNLVYFLHSISGMSPTSVYKPYVAPLAMCPNYIAKYSPPFDELSRFIIRDRDKAKCYHEKMQCVMPSTVDSLI